MTICGVSERRFDRARRIGVFARGAGRGRVRGALDGVVGEFGRARAVGGAVGRAVGVLDGGAMRAAPPCHGS